MFLKKIISGILFSAFILPGICHSENSLEKPEMIKDKLLIIWTSADRDVALKMVFMYAYNSKLNGWWENVEILVWGPSSKLLSEDQELIEYTSKMKKAGVVITACKACSDSYDVSEKLSGLGIDVKYMGKPLTDKLKDGWTTLTF